MKVNKKVQIGGAVALLLLIVGLTGFGVYNVKKHNAEIDAAMQQLLKSVPPAGKKSKETVVKDGSMVIIDFVGYKDGKKFEGGSANDYSLVIGSGSFIDGFEKQLINKKVGSKVDVKVTFPKDYQNTELAGKDVVFKVKIKEIQTPIPNELNDAFAVRASQGQLKTVRELRDYLDLAITQQKMNSGQQQGASTN